MEFSYKELYFGKMENSVLKKIPSESKYVIYFESFGKNNYSLHSLFNSGVSFDYLRGFLSSFVNSNYGGEINIINGIPERVSEKFSNKELISSLDESELESLLLEISPFKERIKESGENIK
jgi:hypothetical protein